MFCNHTRRAYMFHHAMLALTYWAEAVTKRGGRVLLSVQLFDSLEPEYKRMLRQQLRQMQPRKTVPPSVIVIKPTQNPETI